MSIRPGRRLGAEPLLCKALRMKNPRAAGVWSSGEITVGR